MNIKRSVYEKVTENQFLFIAFWSGHKMIYSSVEV